MQWMDLLIAIGWLTTAAFYSYTSQPSRVSAILRPLRLFAMFVSLAWGTWYLWTFFIAWEQGQSGVWENPVAHNIGDGLMFVTITYFLIVRIVTTMNVRKLLGDK